MSPTTTVNGRSLLLSAEAQGDCFECSRTSRQTSNLCIASWQITQIQWLCGSMILHENGWCYRLVPCYHSQWPALPPNCDDSIHCSSPSKAVIAKLRGIFLLPPGSCCWRK